jgi:hypothetical protein
MNYEGIYKLSEVNFQHLQNNLETYSLIPTDNEEVYNDNFQFNTFIDSDPLAISPEENRFFMIFGKEIIDDYNKFVNEVVDVVNNIEKKN